MQSPETVEKERLEKMKLPELKQELKALNQSTSKCLRYGLSNDGLGGNKDKLIERLLCHKFRQHQSSDADSKLEQFLQPTASASEDFQPTVNLFYAQTAKSVDRFNSLLGMIKYPMRIGDTKFLWFVYSILMTSINAWVIYSDLSFGMERSDEEETLKSVCTFSGGGAV